MKIDLKITYDDLSDKCKQQIEKLKQLGYEVVLIYPEIAKKNNSHDSFPDWTQTPYFPGNQQITVTPTKKSNIDVYCTSTMQEKN